MFMKTDLELHLPFLAKRQYLHGTTLFDALCECVPVESRVIFKISKLIRSDRVRIVPIESTIHCGLNDISASLFWELRGKKGILGVEALSPSKKIVWKRYDESLVHDHVSISEDLAVFEGDSPFSLIGTLIPMNKALLNKNIERDGKIQWIFTGIELSAVPIGFSTLALKIKKVVLAARFVKSEIIINGQIVGVLFFSWADQFI